MAGNSDGAAKKKRRRGPGRPFPPGVSGNPSGRPKGFGHLIREATGDGAELKSFALAVMRGDVDALAGFTKGPDGKRAPLVAELPDMKHRLDAHHWLSDQAYGKAPVREDEYAEKSEDELLEALVADSSVWQRLQEKRARLEAAGGGEGPVLQ